MKKFLKSLAFAFVGIMALSSCEDVPAPYIMPEKPSVGNGIGYTSASLKSGWSSMAVNGLNDPWSQGSTYTQATGSQKWDGENRSYKEVEGYLFSPSLNTTSENGKVFTTFDYCVGYTSGATGDPDYKDHIKMYVSKTYQDGDQFVKEQWEEMPFEATFTSTDWTLTTVSVAVPEAYINQENVHFAYWFYAPANKSCTFELKNFKLADTEYVEPAIGDETDAIAVTCAEAVEIINSLEDGATSAETYSVTGYITDVFNSKNKGQQSFWMADTKDGGKILQAFYANLPEGVDKFTAGSKVKITGKLTRYIDKNSKLVPEVANPQVEILEAGGEGGGDNGDNGDKGDDGKVSQSKNGTTLTFTLKDGEIGSNSGMIDLGAYGVAQGLTDGTTVESVTLSDGGTITFSAGTNTNAPKYYSKTKGLRIYGSNIVAIEGKAEIAKVDITCDGADYMGDDAITVAVSGNTWTITNSGSSTTQLRAQTITVTYVK